MMELFSTVKSAVHEFCDRHLDHSLFLSEKDTLIPFVTGQKLAIFPGDPTMEMVGACLLSKFNAILNSEKLYCQSIELEETPTNTVIVRSTLNLPRTKHKWWGRGDMTMNDFPHEETTKYAVLRLKPTDYEPGKV
jgi:6-pyruvoyl-tetrahydropterin synthase